MQIVIETNKPHRKNHLKKTKPKPPYNTQTPTLVVLLLLLLTGAVYFQVKDFEFLNWDDNQFVTENTIIHKGLTIKGIQWAFTATLSTLWHPLAWISHMLDCALYGLNPSGHHMTNLLFHLTNTTLLFYTLLRMTGVLWRSAFVASLFALHPLHVESVAWIAERKDVLSSFFWILTMLLYVRYVEKPDARRYLLVLLTVTLGLLSKPMVVTLPFALLLLDYWPLGRIVFNGDKSDRGKSVIPEIKRLIVEKIPFFLLSAAVSISIFLIVRESGQLYTAETAPFDRRIGYAFISYMTYLYKTVLPVNLAVYYPFPASLPIWQVVGSVLFITFLSFLFLKLYKKSPYLITGWLWYLGTLVPVIGIVKAGHHTMNDRYTYIPLIGIFIIIAWGVPEFLSNQHRKAAIQRAFAIMAVTACIILTWLQLKHWKDSVSLFTHTVNATKNNAMAHNQLGMALTERGREMEAESHFQKAVDANPKYWRAYNNLGIAMEKRGETNKAIDQYSIALRLKPDSWEVLNNKGTALMATGKQEEALTLLTRALQIKPDYVKARVGIGSVLAMTGRMDEAAYHWMEAVRLDPNDAKAHSNLGIYMASKGELDSAEHHFREAIRIMPGFTEAGKNLEILLKEKESRIR